MIPVVMISHLINVKVRYCRSESNLSFLMSGPYRRSQSEIKTLRDF